MTVLNFGESRLKDLDLNDACIQAQAVQRCKVNLQLGVEVH